MAGDRLMAGRRILFVAEGKGGLSEAGFAGFGGIFGIAGERLMVWAAGLFCGGGKGRIAEGQ